jgi:hypothetical protein
MTALHLDHGSHVFGMMLADSVNATECVLASEVVNDLKIRLRLQQSPPEWKGGIYANNHWLTPFALGASNGYGSLFWHISTKQTGANEAIKFAGSIPSRAVSSNERPKNTRYLFPGLGRLLYYGLPELPDLRLQKYPHKGVAIEGQDLIRAGEGFWSIGPGCNDRFVF